MLYYATKARQFNSGKTEAASTTTFFQRVAPDTEDDDADDSRTAGEEGGSVLGYLSTNPPGGSSVYGFVMLGHAGSGTV